jgi:polyphosphate kinase 2 (PPK2 family)
MAAPSYSRMLKNGRTRMECVGNFEEQLERLQLRMLRAQQGVRSAGARVIFVFEGMDAAGKGGAIRRLTEKLDPRGYEAHPIGPPEPDERGHWLARFWKRLPVPGTIAIFDRSWYGRVLVEKVELGLPATEVRRAYREISDFERTLVEDGVVLRKFFLGVSKAEQGKRFEARLRDPEKQWKIGPADLKSRKHWSGYVKAVDEALGKTHAPRHPWTLVAADDKKHARLEVLETALRDLRSFERRAEREIRERGRLSEKEIRRLLGA